MKRLALLLGSLLVVSAAASAKEVVPAPVVVEEAPVQIIEKEVIVYRDKEEGFRPNGYVDLQYRYYGNTEGQNSDYDATNPSAWNKVNDYSRTQLITKINMTENQSFEARIRDYNSLDNASTTTINQKELASKGTQTRLRYWYNHGLVGDSKVDLDSRLEYIKEAATGSQYVEYQAQFNFADYLFNNDFVKTDNFQVAPKYRYAWEDTNNSNYDNQVGVDLYSFFTLPAGFSTEFNVYLTQHFYGQDQEFGEGMKDKNFDAYVEWYLYNTTNLYTNGKYSVDFGFEGGLDGYSWSQEKAFGTNLDQHNNYALYALPYIQVNYQATEFVTLYAAAGAEYRNWVVQNEKSASDWRWQPTAWAGFNVAF